MTFFDWMQAYVFVTSILAVWAVARTDGWHRWGFVFGLASEPGWLYVVVVSTPFQWGTMLLTAWWAWYWGVGAYRRFEWLRKVLSRKNAA